MSNVLDILAPMIREVGGVRSLCLDGTALAAIHMCPRKSLYNLLLRRVSSREDRALTFGKVMAMAWDWRYRTCGSSAMGGAEQEEQLQLIRAAYAGLEPETEPADPLAEGVFEENGKRSYLHAGRACDVMALYNAAYGDEPFEVVGTERHFEHPLGKLRLACWNEDDNDYDYLPLAWEGRYDMVVAVAEGEWVVDGKAQPVTEPVLTPYGWQTMGDLKVGDFVIASSGVPTRVTGIYPQGIKECHRVKLSDGGETICTEDHLWTIRAGNTRKAKFTVKTLRQIMDNPKRDNYALPYLKEVVYFPLKKSLPLHPYLLGLLLGDGYLNGSSIAISGAQDKIDLALSVLPAGMRLRKSKGENFSWVFSAEEGCINVVLKAVRELNLEGTLSDTKFVPHEYLYASVNERKELLRGLLDTDGCCYKGHILYDTTSPQLAQDITALVRSLAGSARIRSLKKRADHKQGYRVAISLPGHFAQPFKLWRKLSRLNPAKEKRSLVRHILSIEPAGKHLTQCISVAHEDQLYVTRDFILTHNTTGQFGSGQDADPWAEYRVHSACLGYCWHWWQETGRVPLGYIINLAIVRPPLQRVTSKSAPRNEFQRQEFPVTEDRLREWQRNTLATAQTWVRYAEDAYWPMHDKKGYSCKYCEFRQVCSAPDDGSRELLLDSESYKINTWQPRNPVDIH